MSGTVSPHSKVSPLPTYKKIPNKDPKETFASAKMSLASSVSRKDFPRLTTNTLLEPQQGSFVTVTATFVTVNGLGCD